MLTLLVPFQYPRKHIMVSFVRERSQMDLARCIVLSATHLQYSKKCQCRGVHRAQKSRWRCCQENRRHHTFYWSIVSDLLCVWHFSPASDCWSLSWPSHLFRLSLELALSALLSCVAWHCLVLVQWLSTHLLGCAVYAHVCACSGINCWPS